MTHNVSAMVSTGIKSNELSIKHLAKTFYFVSSFFYKAKSKILKEYRIVNNQLNYKKNSPQLSCYLDYSLFIQLLVGNFPWNTSLSGSVIMFKRKPNKFYPNMVFSLNYLRN